MMGIAELNMGRRIRPVTITAPRTGKREVGVLQLIEWAFQREHASLDFDEIAREAGARPGVDTVWHLMEGKRLGCRVDGGGRSDPHHDADIVASALAVLPEVYGGRRMALQIAELARAGQRPNWMVGAKHRCVPREWKQNQHGWHSATEQCGFVEVLRRGRVQRLEMRCCPVTYVDTARDVAAARRGYLAWFGALLELRHVFQTHCHMTSHVVTNRMPPRAPWKEG
jgi:hypothetical protein